MVENTVDVRIPYFSPALFYQTKELAKRIEAYQIKHDGVPYPYKLHPVNTKTTSRNSSIIPFCIGYSFLVSTGRIFSHVFVSEDIVGYKFGEFCNTRRRFHFRKKKKKKKNVK